MRKIDRSFENPLDNILISISDSMSDTFYNFGVTPNDLTTLSNITAFITILLLINAKYEWAAFAFLVSYFFDCFDGFFARKYSMTSKFGDLYDHYSDFIKNTATFFTLYYINPDKFMKVLPILIIAMFLCFIQVGCQEKLYDKNESDTLSFLKNLCVSKDSDEEEIKKILQRTRFLGCGTFILTVMVIIIYYGY